MTTPAPRPHHDALARGRQEGREALTTAPWEMSGVFVRYAVLAVPALIFAVHAWRDGRPWIGALVVGVGCLAAAAWGLLQELRGLRRRHDLRERVRRRRTAGRKHG